MNNFEERLQAEVKSREGISNEIMYIISQIVTCMMTMTPSMSTMPNTTSEPKSKCPYKFPKPYV